jgi:glycosyltransferase involved in cell wall biosynthesis
MKKIRIMHLRSATGQGGGPEKTILNSPRYLDARAFEMGIIYLKKKSDPQFALAEKARQMGLKHFFVVEEGSQFDRRAMAQVRQLLQEWGADILHTHGYKSDWWGWLLRRKLPGLKLVTTVHGWTVMQTLRERFYYQAGKLPLYFFDFIIAVSPDIVDALKKIGVPAGKMELIWNAIDTRTFVREQPPGREGPLTVGYIGRLSREKRVEDLLRAFASLRDGTHYRQLIIAGEGPLRGELEQLSRSLQLEEVVQFAGHVDPRWFFNRVDVFVNPSLKEGLPNTILEAMSMETLVIATQVGGVGWLVRDGETGLVIPTERPEAIRQALEQVGSDPSLRLRLTRNARQFVAEHHDFSRRMRRVEAIYRKVVGD